MNPTALITLLTTYPYRVPKTIYRFCFQNITKIWYIPMVLFYHSDLKCTDFCFFLIFVSGITQICSYVFLNVDIYNIFNSKKSIFLCILTTIWHCSKITTVKDHLHESRYQNSSLQYCFRYPITLMWFSSIR